MKRKHSNPGAMCSFYIIGISDESKPAFSDEVKQLLSDSHTFSGGHRHYELVKELLPKQYKWLELVVPLSDTFEKYKTVNDRIIVFASGDPLFFGIGNTIKREFPDAAMQVYPTFYSLQMLAHRCHLPYGNMVVSSLTGRPWSNLDKELIRGSELIGVLTDKRKTPAVIGQRMKAVGLTNYTVYLGERIGGEREKVRNLSIDELAQSNAVMPNCLILQKTQHFNRSIGIPESEFHHLQGRPKMITKRSIRLMSLSMLQLNEAKVCWDIGFCTGSISVEAKQLAPHLDMFSIEKREESRQLMQMNQYKYRVPGITSVIADFYEYDLSNWPAPDRVFIGGHGGRLAEMVEQLSKHLLPGGIMVFNAVSKEAVDAFQEAIKMTSLQITDKMLLQQDAHNPVTVFQATKPLSQNTEHSESTF